MDSPVVILSKFMVACPLTTMLPNMVLVPVMGQLSVLRTASSTVALAVANNALTECKVSFNLFSLASTSRLNASSGLSVRTTSYVSL